MLICVDGKPNPFTMSFKIQKILNHFNFWMFFIGSVLVSCIVVVTEITV